jgi:hypothetical protein
MGVLLAVSGGAIAVIVVGIALLALVVIVVGPSRRVRAEPPMDPAVEAALLLGEDPDEVAHEEPARTGEHESDDDTAIGDSGLPEADQA